MAAIAIATASARPPTPPPCTSERCSVAGRELQRPLTLLVGAFDDAGDQVRMLGVLRSRRVSSADMIECSSSDTMSGCGGRPPKPASTSRALAVTAWTARPARARSSSGSKQRSAPNRASSLPLTRGIAEILEKINEILPSWLDEVLSNKVTEAQLAATITEYLKRISRLQNSGSPQSAITSTHLRLGPTILPFVEKARTEGLNYLRVSLDLDPWMIMAGREPRLHPENQSMFHPVKEALFEAIEAIEEQEQVRRHKHEGGDDHFVIDHVLEIGHLSRTLGRAFATFKEYEKSSQDANEIVRRWWQDLEPLID
jgi:hypothetical protein